VLAVVKQTAQPEHLWTQCSAHWPMPRAVLAAVLRVAQPVRHWMQRLILCWEWLPIRLWRRLPACWTQPSLLTQSVVVCQFKQKLYSEFAFLAGGKT
jgi:hypothetical protein